MQKQNYYEVLGLTAVATLEQIKKIYKILAVKWHPDKHGDKSKEEQESAVERFKEISAAYETLSDPEKRVAYDEKLKLSKITLDEEEIIDLSLLRIKRHRQSLSEKFKVFHKDFVSKYQQENLEKNDEPSSFLQSFPGDVYKDATSGETFPTIFTFVKFKRNQTCVPLEFQDKLTPQTAFTLFLGFLKGNYYGKVLHELINLFDEAVQSTKEVEESNLYNGIKDILVLCVVTSDLDESLIQAIRKITDYAKRYATYPNAMSYMAPLLQSKYFRQLFTVALNTYWLTDIDINDHEKLNAFNGEQEARKLFEENKKNLFSDDKKENLINFIRTLHKFEKTTHEFTKNPNLDLAEFYRNKAYLILDWSEALSGHVTPNILVNTFLQAGVYFQIASKQLQKPELQMADEALAFKCYLEAHAWAHHTTPDVSLYVHVHSLKYILRFTYTHDDLAEVIYAIQDKALLISNIFPFFENVQSNIAFFIQKDQMLVLMRQLLHALTNMLAYNETSSEKLELDHQYVTILYQAYEACLKNWYDEQFNPEVEKKFRLKLMLELLNLNRWTFVHIKSNLISPAHSGLNVAVPWVTVKRDEQGWIRPNRHLEMPNDPKIKYYRGLKGLEINQKTGEINFVFEPASTSNTSYTEQLISLFDLNEILTAKATGAIFSLDPADPKPYHPFNKILFRPYKLNNSQLVHTMFLADYLLKFLTVGFEVQADEPFDMKSVNELIKKLPPHLKKIIFDFRRAKRKRGDDAVHRFWIQAEEMSYEENEEKERKEIGIRKIAFDSVRMIICKHVMSRDHKGNLVDTEEKGEGWKMYVLSPDELLKNIDHIEDPAMIWIDKNAVCFFENDQCSKPYIVRNCGQYLAKLFHLERDEYNKIIAEDIDAVETIYRLTKKVADQTGVDDNFSPEYIFAREFSIHYNEFAIHFPELARLRELSRAVMIARILEAERQQNLHEINARREIIAEHDDAFWKKNIAEFTEKISNDFNLIFSDWRANFTLKKIRKSQLKKINNLYKQIDGWNSLGKISIFRQEFENRVKSQGIYDFNRHDVIDAWNKHLSEIQSNSNQQRQSFQKQFREFFKREFDNYSFNEITDILNNFLDGDFDPLLSVLINHNIREIKKIMKQVYPDYSEDDLWEVLNDESSYAFNKIIDIAIAAHKENLKQQFRKDIEEYKRMNKPLQALGLDDTCELVFMSSPPTLETFEQFPEIKTAYVRSDKTLHYMDITRKECIEIPLDDQELQEFDANFKLNQNESRTLTDKELREITAITGHDPEELDLSSTCLWVPASIHHEVEKSYSYTVYGGVRIAGNINRLNSGAGLLAQQALNRNNATMSGSRLGGGGSRGGGGSSGGGNSGGGGNGPSKPSQRFTVLAANVSKSEVRGLLKQGNLGMTSDQINKVAKCLKKGATDSVSLKLMNNGEVRLSYTRPGHTDGYQRMSYGIDAQGKINKMLQTAFDNNNKLVRQNPGMPKNNLYDVKKWTKTP